MDSVCNGIGLLDFYIAAQVRLRLQVPVQLACLVLSLALPTAVCKACQPKGALPLLCLAGLHAAQLLLGGALPVAVVYFSERRFRRNFVVQLAKSE